MYFDNKFIVLNFLTVVRVFTLSYGENTVIDEVMWKMNEERCTEYVLFRGCVLWPFQIQWNYSFSWDHKT